MQVHQVLATLAHGDAIGNHAMGIQRVLRAAGYTSDIFVETAETSVQPLTRDYRDLPACSAPDNILIHHFSIASRASRVAFALPDKMILVYHNVTPAAYFLDVNDVVAAMCYRGRRELAAYAGRVQLALGASEFNRQELEAAGFPVTGVLPVVPDFTHLDVEPDRVTIDAFDDQMVNVLYVGRVIPNKKIEDVIRFFATYNGRFNPASRLLIVGSWRGFESYQELLQAFVARERIPNVHFAGHVSNQELSAYYDVADVFLCASEHEGFCVPIVESFYKRVPVLAYGAAAVPSTLDGAGILYDRKDPELVAGLIDLVTRDAGLAQRIVDGQVRALERRRTEDFARQLLRFVHQVSAGPPGKAPRLTPDFWQQFERACERRPRRGVVS